MRFGRKKDDDVPEGLEGLEESVDGAPAGPRDVAEMGEAELEEYVDLGSLLIPPRPDTELRLQVDEESGQVLAVLLLDADGMLELRAFAGERNGDLWSDVRREIAADTAQRGGTASEQDGPFGPELYCQIPVQLEDGSGGMQPSRVIGHNGPRWFLRAALLGRPAVEPAAAEPWEDTIRSVVVRRGAGAMPPGEALPLQLPPDAQRVG